MPHTTKHKYIIPVSWIMCDDLKIEADSLQEAIEIAEDDRYELPEGEYCSGSFEVNMDCVYEFNGEKREIK